MLMKITRSLAVSLLLATSLHGVAQASTIYDAAADFSFASNPNNVWTYGFKTTLGGAFTAYTQTTTFSGLQIWTTNIGNTLTPSVNFNPTAVDIPAVGTVFRSRQVNLHPGPGLELGVLRFTAQVAGDYTLTSSFNMRSNGGTASTDVHVRLNNVASFDDIVTGFNQQRNFNATYTLAAGDKIDFLVGANGNFNGDTTELRARLELAPVPEPESWAMLLAGLAVTGFAVRRRVPKIN